MLLLIGLTGKLQDKYLDLNTSNVTVNHINILISGVVIVFKYI